MKPTRKCPWYEEDNEECTNDCEHYDTECHHDHVIVYCSIDAANDQEYISKSDWLCDSVFESKTGR